MKLNDHLDFHKLPFDKEKIRAQVEKIAADCMHWVTSRQNARPLLALALCTCIAFSAMFPYIPVIAPAETSTERIYEPETVDILELRQRRAFLTLLERKNIGRSTDLQ